MNLREKAFRGVKWSAVSQVGRQVVTLLTILILVQLLPPEDFGLLGMVNIVTGFALLFRNLGTSAAVIQKMALSSRLIITLFWVNAFVGILLGGIMVLIAPLVASFFSEELITKILWVMSAGFAVSGLSVIHQGLLEKEMQFKKLALMEIVAVATGSSASIYLAYNGFGVWSLVVQHLAITVMTTLLLWVFAPVRIALVFSVSELKEVLKFGLNLTGFNVVNYLIRNGDYFLIGKFLGAEALGLYTLAYRIMLYPLQIFNSIISRVMFPLYSKIQKEDLLIRKANYNVVVSVAMMTFPVMTLVFCLSHEIVTTFLPERWFGIIPLLMILSPVGAMQSVGTTVGTIYQAKGRTDIMLRWGVFAGFIILPGFVVGLNWGLTGVAVAYSIVSLLLFYPNFAIPYKLIDLKVSMITKPLLKIFASCLVVVFVIISGKMLIVDYFNMYLYLSLLILLGVLTYTSLLLTFMKSITNHLKSELMN